MQQMENKCIELKQKQTQQKQQWSHLFVNKQRQCIYCAISKAGSTTWRYILLKLAGEGLPNRSPNYRNNPKLQSILIPKNLNRIVKQGHYFNSTERNMLMQTYYKFTFVREPLERLVSAYRYSILHHRASDMARIITAIKKRRQSLNDENRGNCTVGFFAFLALVINV